MIVITNMIDMMNNRVPYGFLTDEEKAVLKDHEDAGGGIICYVFARDGGFWTPATYSRFNHEIYRTVPLPRDEDHEHAKKCPNKDQNGNCPLHNLHCQYPKCES